MPLDTLLDTLPDLDDTDVPTKPVDPVMLAFMHDVRRRYVAQVRSNPVPSAPVLEWLVRGDVWVGAKEGWPTLMIERVTRAPARRIRHDRGTVTRTLGNGLGTVELDPRTLGKPKALRGSWGSVVHSPRQGVAIPADRLALAKRGVKQPKAPSWKQEVAGWSADYRIERGDRSLFDDCGSVRNKPLRGWVRAPSW
jgi:hypothetical protein